MSTSRRRGPLAAALLCLLLAGCSQPAPGTSSGSDAAAAAAVVPVAATDRTLTDMLKSIEDQGRALVLNEVCSVPVKDDSPSAPSMLYSVFRPDSVYVRSTSKDGYVLEAAGYTRVGSSFYALSRAVRTILHEKFGPYLGVENDFIDGVLADAGALGATSVTGTINEIAEIKAPPTQQMTLSFAMVSSAVGQFRDGLDGVSMTRSPDGSVYVWASEPIGVTQTMTVSDGRLTGVRRVERGTSGAPLGNEQPGNAAASAKVTECALTYTPEVPSWLTVPPPGPQVPYQAFVSRSQRVTP